MRLSFLVLLVLLLALTFIGPSQAASPHADTIFVNGDIVTGNDKLPRAEAVAVRAGRIVFVGTSTSARKYADTTTRIVDLKGAAVFPGFTDSHCHLSAIGLRELSLNLEGTTGLEDFLARVKTRVDRAAAGEWVTGAGWIETFWKPQAFPTRQDLDRVAPNNPVYLVRADGHGAVVNSKALEAAKIDRDTKSPFGGEIMRDAAGDPNGMILDNARELVTKLIPPTSEADLEKAVVVGSERELSLGWCEIQNAGSELEDVARFRKLFEENKVRIRLYNAVYGPGPAADKLIADGPVIGAYGGRFTMRTIKVVLDGALGSKGAALLKPYSDYNSSGFLTHTDAELRPMLEAALRAGIQVETHAIGDRANRTILDDYEWAFGAVEKGSRRIAEPRWRVEHAQILDVADIPRFAKLGVIPSMQPSHAIGDLYFAPSRLGLDRLVGAYAWQSLLKTGVIIAGGSDAPVERGEPMIEFYAAVARKDLKGNSGEGWHPEQAVSREQALKMFTLWPAIAAFEEKDKGTIEIGKFADMTVLSANIMTIPVAEIPKTQCLMTVVGGDVVFTRP